MEAKKGFKQYMLLAILLIVVVVIHFFKPFGYNSLISHLVLHSGAIVFCFVIMILSFRLKDKAMNNVLIGALLVILSNSVLLLAHVFAEYEFLTENFLVISPEVIGYLLIMGGFRKA